MPFRDVRAIYFDLDDTLCAYWDASKAALREAFTHHGPEGRTYEEMVQAWAEAFRKFSPTLKSTDWYKTYLKVGKPTRDEQMRLTLREVGIDDPAQAERMGDAYGHHRDANLKLFEESLPILEILYPRMPLGLITNGPADIQRQEVNTLNIGHFFDPILIEGELGFGKPDHRVYEIALQAFRNKIADLEPDQILMVGNSFAHDIGGARRAGWKTAWVRRPSDVPPSAKGPEEMPPNATPADLVIGDLRELLPALGIESA
jgi:putative hydrolase of the HAD superfamily